MARDCDDKLEMADVRHFTHFVDATDGQGFYRDYKTLRGAIAAHRRAMKNSLTARSWVRGYSADRLRARSIADWVPGQKAYSEKRTLINA